MSCNGAFEGGDEMVVTVPVYVCGPRALARDVLAVATMPRLWRHDIVHAAGTRTSTSAGLRLDVRTEPFEW